MFYLTNTVQLQAITLLEDMASREGAPYPDSPCPKGGARDTALNKFCTVKVDSSLPKKLAQTRPDFDADVAKPTMAIEDFFDGDDEVDFDEFVEISQSEKTTAQYNPAVHDVTFDSYYRRLEDIHEFYIHRYVGNVVFSFVRQGGASEELVKSKGQYTIVNQSGDDEGGPLQESDLLLQESPYTGNAKEIEDAKKYLPYVVKRLYGFSRIVGIHVPSYIQKYLIAKKELKLNRQSGASVATLKYTNVTRKTVYAFKPGRNFLDDPITNLKNSKASELFDWINGFTHKWASFYQNYRDLLHYCAVLNIDLTKGDLTEINEEFVRGLTISVVTPNEQFNAIVMEAMRNNESQSVEVPQMSENDIIDNTRELYSIYLRENTELLNSVAMKSSIQRDTDLRAAKFLYYRYLCALTRKAYPPDVMNQMSWRNGYLFYGGRYAVIGLNYLDDRFKIPGCYYDVALIHESCWLIHYSTAHQLFLMNLPKLHLWYTWKLQNRDVDENDGPAMPQWEVV